MVVGCRVSHELTMCPSAVPLWTCMCMVSRNLTHSDQLAAIRMECNGLECGGSSQAGAAPARAQLPQDAAAVHAGAGALCPCAGLPQHDAADGALHPHAPCHTSAGRR